MAMVSSAVGYAVTDDTTKDISGTGSTFDFTRRKKWPQLLLQELAGAALFCLKPVMQHRGSNASGGGSGQGGGAFGWKVSCLVCAVTTRAEVESAWCERGTGERGTGERREEREARSVRSKEEKSKEEKRGRGEKWQVQDLRYVNRVRATVRRAWQEPSERRVPSRAAAVRLQRIGVSDTGRASVLRSGLESGYKTEPEGCAGGIGGSHIVRSHRRLPVLE